MRLPECATCNIPTAKIINLSDVFGKNDETDKFLDEIRADNGVIPGSLEVERVKGNLANGWELDPVLFDTLNNICKNIDIDIEDYAA